MKRMAITFAGLAILGSALAYDDELTWLYDESKRPADVVSVQPADLADGVDARANVAQTMEATPPDAPLESRGWSSWLSGLLKLTRLGTMIFFR